MSSQKPQSDSEKLDRILTKLEDMDKKIGNTSQDLKELKTKLDGDFKAVNNQLDPQSSRIIQLERQVRKRNLVLLGVPEGENGIQDEQAAILDLITKVMNINCGSDDIEDVYRVRRWQADQKQPRPICLVLNRLNLKNELYAARSTLESKHIRLKEDLPIEIRQQRRAWWNQHHNKGKDEDGSRKRPPQSPADKDRPKKQTSKN